MKPLAYIFVGMVLGALITAIAIFQWAHEAYTVGMDINWKAIVVAAVGVALLVVGSFVIRSWLRRRRS